ncbi:MAG: hypothetical protein FWE44_07005 [Defluviitaleaceae bacterium]|nr:hypothetical protein [Defluviitaleaceae bacterium]
MRILSEPSLKCFLYDLRNAASFLRSQLPKNIHFINADSFYFYLNLAYPQKSAQIRVLMSVLEPYVPLILSEASLYSLFDAYSLGDMPQLLVLQQNLDARSKLLFINSAIDATEEHWQSIMDTCLAIRKQM